MQAIKLKTTNTSGIEHISYNKQNQKWDVRRVENGQRKYLGSYATVEEAKQALISGKFLYAKKQTNTGHQYISYIVSNDCFYFQKKVDGKSYIRCFKSLEQAIIARDKFLNPSTNLVQSTLYCLS